MRLNTNPLKDKYPISVRIAGLSGVLGLIFIFLVFPRFVNESEFGSVDQIVIENIDIPQTQQLDNTPPPARPSIPVPTDDEDIADDVTLDDLDFDDFEAWDAPPAPSGPKVKFIPYDDPPKPISAIRPVYPEIAQEAGIEGTIYIQFFINEKGNVTEAWVQKGIPNTGLNEAALEAVKKSTWKPAQQRDKKVGVWQTVPVKFELTSN